MGGFHLPKGLVSEITKVAKKVGVSESLVHQGLQALDLEEKRPGPPNSGGGYRPPPGPTPYDSHEAGPSTAPPPPQHQAVAPRPDLVGGPVTPTHEELGNFQAAVNKLWDLDVNRLQPGVDYEIEAGEGKKIYDKTDIAEHSLFRFVKEDVLRRPTYAAFYALLDNYVAQQGVTETVTQVEVQEMTAFLDHICATPVMQYLHKLLTAKNLAPPDLIAFKKLLWKMWFELYGRDGGRQSSSGFEHVFVGEYKEGEVGGLHNWIQIYLLEKSKALNYTGYIVPRCRGAPRPDSYTHLLTIQFEWMNQTKGASSTFIGTSPEFEIALYSFCFLAGAESNRVAIAGSNLNIKCYNLSGRIGSAYPEIED